MKKIILTLTTFIIFSGFALCKISGENHSSLENINRVLDSFHKAASVADEKGYLGCLAEDGVFLGTDSNEIWSKSEFAAFVKPYFSKSIGWTYKPKNRIVHISKDNKFAWFSEKLFNDKYGELRGTGVLRKNQNSWKIVQYNMVFTIPNSCSKEVVEIIRKNGKNNNDKRP